MKRISPTKRLLAFALAVAVCFSLVPWTVFGAETGTYTQVTTAEAFTSGQYVLITDTGYAPLVLESGWITAAQPTVTDGVVTDTAGAVWNLTVDGTSVKLSDSNGVAVAPKGGNNNGITSGDYAWAWTFADGKFTFSGVGADTVVLAGNVGSSNKFRGYKTTTVAGNPAGFPCSFTAYKLVESSVEPEPEETTAPETAVADIADALAAAEGEFTVKGVVTLLDGKNVYIQDATGGICLRVGSTPSDLYLGATILATGSKTVYNGLPQLGSGSYELAEGLELAAKDTTIGSLTEADICTYVRLRGLEVTEVYDNNGSYSAPNITVTDGVDTIQIYKAVVGKTDDTWDVKVGDRLDVLAAVGIYNGTFQLRNTMSSEIVVTTVSETDPENPGDTAGITWTRVEFSDIKAADIIAITMTRDGTTWVLPNAGEGGKGQPLASCRGTVDGSTLTTDTQLLYSWNIAATEGGYHILSVNGEYLYVTAANNGVRIGSTAAVWNVAGGYLASPDPNGDTRYLGVYNNQDWRCYTNTTGNTAGQTLEFWKLSSSESSEPEEPAAGIPEGDYVIWVPAYNKALSSEKTGNYNVGVDVTLKGEILSGYGASEIWTVTNNGDGTITISQNGSVLSMAAKYSSLTMNEVNSAWTLTDLGDGLFNVQNVGRGNYLEWYDQYSNWSTYNSSSAATDGQFRIMFTPAEVITQTVTDSSVVENIAQWSGLTNAGNTAFVYGDKYVSGDEKDTEDVFTAVVSGQTVTPWTQGGSSDSPLYYMGAAGLGSGTDDYLQFAVNAAGWGDMKLSFRLRASNSGPGSFRVKYSADNGATWQNFTAGSYSYVGYNSEGSSYSASGDIADGIARTSLAPGKYVTFVFDVPAGADNCSQLLIRLVPGTEKAKGDGNIGSGGTTRVEGVDLSGSPIVGEGITGFVTVEPDGAEDQSVGTELTMTSATGDAAIYYRVSGGEWIVYDPENKPVLETLPCDIEAYAVSADRAASVVLLYRYAAGTVETVKFSPNGGGIHIQGETYEITLSTATEDATVYYAVSADGENFTNFSEYTAPVVVNKGFGKLVIKAYARKDGYKDSAESIRTFTERSSDTWQLFFGQLHSHTNISDGAGTIEEAYDYASRVEGLDFLAVTDHSNAFDNEKQGVLAEDGSLISEEWKLAQAAADAITVEGEFVGLYGFEMTWSGGSPGHINTFNTPGWQSRSQDAYRDKSVTALQSYFDALATVPGSISQFNHPGTTFGDFFDFGCYSESADALITLIEVGNGEGTIGSSGYFPSYEYYTRALDKGWHVAPTNNQDNHKGMWGNANTGRTVILADFLSEESIYDALRNYRVYATEDSDLQIWYTLNGYTMGTILNGSNVEENVTISVTVADSTDGVGGTLEVIVNGGLTAASCNLSGRTGTVELTVPADYNYYYIRITQTDGDIAVTAPVWVGEVEAVGIASLKTATDMTIAGEEQTILAELFNNENGDLVVESLVYTDKATGEILYTDVSVTSVPGEGTASSSFSHTFEKDGVCTITATLKGSLNGVPKTYTKELEITVMPENITSRIIVDGTHYNDYVSGYYAGNMGNMTAIAGAQGIDVHMETVKITPEMLENCALLVISAPNTRTGEDYPLSAFEEDFIAMVAEYVRSGGNVVFCGIADYQDKQNDGIHETSVQLNKLLSAVGSSMRINDDEAYDEVNFSNQNYRLYPSTFNVESPWCAGLAEGQKYSQYSGCTVDPGSGTWLVRGHDTTYSIDSDKDGKGGIALGEAVFLAAEDTGFGGTVFAAGGVFLSDYEVKADMDNIWDLPYANRTIYENIIGITRSEPEITPIAAVRESAEAELGRIFVIEGYVTAGTVNPGNTFFDAVYVQDATGGITVFPYAEPGLKLGTKVRIAGFTDAYQGDIEIQVMSLEILEEPRQVVDPQKVSAKDAMDYENNGGRLLQVEGEVVEVTLSSDGKGVSRFVVKDENGDLAKVFIDGYILSGTTGENTLADIVKVGNTVSAVGLLYMHPERDSATSVAVLRVRDCDEVILVREKAEEENPADPSEPSEPGKTDTDKSELEKAVNTARSKKAKDYTKKSFDAMKKALKAAEAVLKDEKATQEEINAAADALNAAIKALKPNTGRNPGTSDSACIELSLFVMTASLLTMAVLIINRKRFIV